MFVDIGEGRVVTGIPEFIALVMFIWGLKYCCSGLIKLF